MQKPYDNYKPGGKSKRCGKVATHYVSGGQGAFRKPVPVCDAHARGYKSDKRWVVVPWEDGLGGKYAFCRECAWLRQLWLAAKVTVGGRLASEKDLCILFQACGDAVIQIPF